jgi:general secretion pathway protein G
VAARLRPRGETGFTLVELLIVVAIVGLIAAIAVPNLLNALDRGKQKRTMGDIRAIASAIEAYTIDHSRYPDATDIDGLRAILESDFIRTMPLADGWNNRFVAVSAAAGYTVASEGKDGAGGVTACAGAPTCGNLDDSIVFINGQFIQWPDGIQR